MTCKNVPIVYANESAEDEDLSFYMVTYIIVNKQIAQKEVDKSLIKPARYFINYKTQVIIFINL